MGLYAMLQMLEKFRTPSSATDESFKHNILRYCSKSSSKNSNYSLPQGLQLFLSEFKKRLHQRSPSLQHEPLNGCLTYVGYTFSLEQRSKAHLTHSANGSDLTALCWNVESFIRRPRIYAQDRNHLHSLARGASLLGGVGFCLPCTVL